MMKVFQPFISWRSRWYALKVLMSNQLAEGPYVKLFEKEFAKRFSLREHTCIAVNSGTSALELAFELAGVKPGDEVITPVLTCTATNLPILHRGAKCVFADITNDMLMDPDDVEKRITKKTKAIVYVDFGGASHTLAQVMAIAHKHNLPVIRDSAQSISDNFQSAGDFVCISFQAIKTLTAGDGGMLICNRNSADAAKARRLRWFGIDRPIKQRFGDVDVEEAGYKYHMNDISASIALGNLRTLPKIFRRRAAIARAYRNEYIASALSSSPVRMRLIKTPWMMILVHPRVPQIREFLASYGIESSPYHYRNDKYTVFGDRRKDLPNMDRLEDSYTLLPYHTKMRPKDARLVVRTLEKFLWK